MLWRKSTNLKSAHLVNVRLYQWLKDYAIRYDLIAYENNNNTNNDSRILREKNLTESSTRAGICSPCTFNLWYHFAPTFYILHFVLHKNVMIDGKYVVNIAFSRHKFLINKCPLFPQKQCFFLHFQWQNSGKNGNQLNITLKFSISFYFYLTIKYVIAYWSN